MPEPADKGFLSHPANLPPPCHALDALSLTHMLVLLPRCMMNAPTPTIRADSHQPAAGPAPARAPAEATGLRRRGQAAAAGGQAGAAAAAGGPAQPWRQRGAPGGLLGLPFKLVASGVHVMSSVVQLTFTLAGMMGDKVLPASVMRAARGG